MSNVQPMCIFVGGSHDGMRMELPDTDDYRRLQVKDPHNQGAISDYQQHRLCVGDTLVRIYGLVGMKENDCYLQIINRYTCLANVPIPSAPNAGNAGPSRAPS